MTANPGGEIPPAFVLDGLRRELDSLRVVFTVAGTKAEDGRTAADIERELADATE